MYTTRRLMSFGRVKSLKVVALLVLLLVVVLVLENHGRPPNIYRYTAGTTTPWRKWNDTAAADRAERSDEQLYLYYLQQQYGLTREVSWFARRIRTRTGARTRLSLTDVRSRFVGSGFAQVKVDGHPTRLRVDGPMTLPVHSSPRPGEIDASALLFGISTTYSRIVHADYAMIRDLQRWLADGSGTSNGATLLLTLHRSTSLEAQHVFAELAKAGINAVVTPIEDDMDPAARYQDLIRRMVATHAEQQQQQQGQVKKYLVLADDDMFFPNLDLLLRRLAKYSPSKEYYLGAPSERLDWTKVNRTLLTYGGGAVILTPPLAARLTTLPCAGVDAQRAAAGDDDDDDDRAAAAAQWDYALYRCITAHTGLDLHVLPSFYNPQGAGLLGFGGAALNEGYGGGARPLALHQYRSFHRFEAGRGHEVASLCGADCFLQRFRFRDGWILVAGHTVSHYPDGVGAVPLRQSSRLMAQLYGDAWRAALGRRIVVDDDDDDGDGAGADDGDDAKVVHWTGRKRTWRLLDSSTRDGSGQVWQAYVKRRSGEDAFSDVDDQLEWGGGEEHDDLDSLIVVIWEP